MIKLPLYRADGRQYALVDSCADFKACSVCALRDVCFTHVKKEDEVYNSLCLEFLRKNEFESWETNDPFFVDVTDHLYNN